MRAYWDSKRWRELVMFLKSCLSQMQFDTLNMGMPGA
jgi:hypothetical protein